jgi:NAD(P)-dependent dehydrogenase (short-subunit alcohol dehydrogenase family)
VVNYRVSKANAIDTADEVTALGCEAAIVQGDAGIETDAHVIIQTAVDRFGELAFLVNNAGTTHFIPHADLDACTDEVWDEIMRTNLYGTWYCSRAAAPHLRRSKGSIVNVGSIAGHRAGGSSIPYSVSKAAVIHLTRALAVALAPEVTVNSVSPGLVDTRWVVQKKDAQFAREQQERWAARSLLKKVVSPGDVADAIVGYLGLTSVTGQDLIVDTGQTIIQPF